MYVILQTEGDVIGNLGQGASLASAGSAHILSLIARTGAVTTLPELQPYFVNLSSVHYNTACPPLI